MLEAVASQDLLIWHAFFWLSGANNDLNILYCSNLFDDVLDDVAPECPFTVDEARDPVMSSSSTVTYISVYTDSEPGRVFWGAEEELSDGAPPSLDYVPRPEHPPSPDYVPGLEHPPSPVVVPYVPEPEYPEYLVSSDAEAPLEDQPLPADASPTALSPDYDDDDEPSDDDDDDTDNEDEEPFKDEDDDDEEEEHLALADSSVVPVVDPVPSAGDTESFETNESAPTPRSPQIRIPFAQTRLSRIRKTFRLEPPMSPSTEARIAEYAAAPAPSSPPPSPL
ncbi:putative reverse transcriptase domain-containing protein [Tanacetum coccineum]